MTEKDLASAQKSLSRETTRASDYYVTPAVDILETEDGLTLLADMPGLDDKSLEISVEQGVLTIRGNAPAGDGEYLRREFAMTGFWRQFALADSFDADRAEASIAHGVVTLKIPKAEAAKPKRIAVNVN
jgi:HSP20 family molecular chaperone IbpA